MALTIEQQRALASARARRRRLEAAPPLPPSATPEERTAREQAQRTDQLRRELSHAQSLFADKERAPGMVHGLAGAAAQGLSFGFADEITAAARAAAGAPGPETFGDLYRNAMLESRLERTRFKRAHPGLALGTEIGAGVGTGGTVLNLGKSVLRNVPAAARLSGVGAVEGAAYGAGTALPGERARGAAVGGTLGALGAPVVGGIATVGGLALRPVARKLWESLTDTPRSKAQRIIREAMEADDITPDEAAYLLREMGSDATLSDLGENLTRQGRLAASAPGPGAARARRFLDERQRGQQHRLIESARRATGSDDFDRGVLEIVDGAATRAAPLYDEAYKAPFTMTPELEKLMNRPAMILAKRKALTIIENEGLSGSVPDVQYLDAIKRALDDQIGVAIRNGERNDARILQGIKRELVSEIDEQVPAYRQARDVFAGEAAIKDAAAAGRSAFKPSTDLPDLAERVGTMTVSEQQAFRTGVLRAFSDRLAGSAETRNLAKQFTETPRFRKLMQIAFPDQDAFERFLQTAQAESRFSATRNTVLGGSQTAPRMADREAAAASMGTTLADAIDAPARTLLSVFRSVTTNDKLTPEVMDEMARLLFDPSVIPQRVRRGLEIPVTNPSVFSGRVGGAVATQTDPLQAYLREIGFLPGANAAANADGRVNQDAAPSIAEREKIEASGAYRPGGR